MVATGFYIDVLCKNWHVVWVDLWFEALKLAPPLKSTVMIAAVLSRGQCY